MGAIGTTPREITERPHARRTAHAGVCLSTAIRERPHAPSGVAVFMSAHSKTPYITPRGKVLVWGCRGQQLGFACELLKSESKNHGSPALYLERFKGY